MQVNAAAIYPFKTDPFQHQLTCFLRNKTLDAFAYFMEMGAGKSKVLIDTAAYMYDQDRINALVVIAPKGVYRNWWDLDKGTGQPVGELPTHMPAHVRYRVGIWSADATKAELEALDRLRPSGPDYDLHVLLLNVEALGRDLDNNRAYKYLERFLLDHRALLAVDESTVIKNPKATRTKALLKLRRLAPVRRILSGQPAVNGPLDLYSQCEFLGPDLLGFGSYYTFKAHFATLVPMFVHLGNGKKRKFTKVTGYKNLEELHKILSQFSFMVKKEDCLDLPQKLPPVKRTVELGPKQLKAYQQMKRLCIAEIENGLAVNNTGPVLGDFELTGNVDPARVSTASLVITQMLRLHQILCGFIVTDDKKPVLFDEPNPRLEDLIETLNELDHAIIWATYKVSVRQITERIAKEFGPDSVLTYYGDTNTADRATARLHFDPRTRPKDSAARFIVANQTGARGLNLTVAHTGIYYSYTHDLDIHEQSKDRIHRIGQHWPCSYLYQHAPGSVEDKILYALVNKLDISQQITASNWRTYIQ